MGTGRLARVDDAARWMLLRALPRRGSVLAESSTVYSASATHHESVACFWTGRVELPAETTRALLDDAVRTNDSRCSPRRSAPPPTA